MLYGLERRRREVPIYSFKCPACETTKEVLFKTLPSHEKQTKSPCDNCDGVMVRDHGAEPIHVVGGTSFEVQKAANFAMKKVDVGGRQAPAFKDANGKVHEVRNSGDIEKWMKSNQSGKPRMVEWTNSKTGEKSWVPQRTVMRAGPDGMPLDAGVIIKESAKLIPLNKEYRIPSVDRKTGYRIDPVKGVVVQAPSKPLKHSRHCMCIKCCMSAEDEPGYGGGVDPSHFLPSKE